MNKTIITGNLGDDAQIKTSAKDNKDYMVFSVAHTEKEITTWFKCFIQNEKLVKSRLIDFLKKGTKVLLEGRLTANYYEEKKTINYVLNVFTLELISTPPKTEVTNTGSNTAKVDDDLPF